MIKGVVTVFGVILVIALCAAAIYWGATAIAGVLRIGELRERRRMRKMLKEEQEQSKS